MIILHIADIQTNLDNGVNAVVPKHVSEQAKHADVALININNIAIDGVKQLKYIKGEDFIGNLESPYNCPDLVVFHEANIIEYISLYKQLKRKKIPYIIVPHGEITEQALKKKWLKKKIAYLLWFNSFVKNAKAIQCLSQGELERSKIASNKFIASNGTDIPKESKLYRTDNGMKLLYIGRLDWLHKGLDLMINSIGRIQDFARKNNITLDIYGPDLYGRKKKVEEIIVKNNVSDIVKIYDPVFGDEKKNILLEHDVFIQTSRFEGQPLGLLEAMSYGMVIIATEGTNFADDILKSRGGYNAGRDEVEIINAIKIAYEDKENWAEKGLNARNYIIQNYSWEKIGIGEVEKYKSIV